MSDDFMEKYDEIGRKFDPEFQKEGELIEYFQEIYPNEYVVAKQQRIEEEGLEDEGFEVFNRWFTE
jgi:hypothetical protein